jgi:hypothetical protein
MQTKPFREVKQGDHFQIQGSSGKTLLALEDARADRERGATYVKTDRYTMSGLGHLVVEMRPAPVCKCLLIEESPPKRSWWAADNCSIHGETCD